MDHFAVFICVNTYKSRPESDTKLNTILRRHYRSKLAALGESIFSY